MPTYRTELAADNPSHRPDAPWGSRESYLWLVAPGRPVTAPNVEAALDKAIEVYAGPPLAWVTVVTPAGREHTRHVRNRRLPGDTQTSTVPRMWLRVAELPR
jgi:hypothetical protein